MKSRWSLALVAWLAASLAASANGLAAGPQQATPPPLPPDTVNQVGLQWKLHTIGWGDKEATKPFRYSLCEGRYLGADEVSRPCNPSPESTASGGHQASYVFSAGHGGFLPEGLSIDGFGILHGDDPALLAKVKNNKLPLCVRQLHVERCKDVQLDEKTRLQEDPIAQQIDNGSGPPKKGVNVGRVLGAVAAGTAAGLGGMYLANQYAAVDSSGSASGGYDGTYDFAFVYSVQGGNQQRMLSQFFRVNGGNITSSDGTLRGSVASSGATSFVGPCPINSEPADYLGNLSRSGSGEGTYRCRFGGISRTWSVFKR